MNTSSGGCSPTAFISYAHPNRHSGGQVKKALKELGIDGFLAHEDLHVSEEWQARLLQELRRCDVFVPILSTEFVASRWALQEVGFIASRLELVVVIPLALDETVPFGFLSHLQSCRIPAGGVTRHLLMEPMLRRVPRTVVPSLIRLAARSASFRDAEAKVGPLVPHFGVFTDEEAQAFAAACVENGQIWAAQLCRDDYLPEFLRLNESKLNPAMREKLEFQIENQRWYPK